MASIEEAKALDEAATMLAHQHQATPAERREIEKHIIDQIVSVAAACGTTVSFTQEPIFEDRSLLIDSSATSDQVACVHKRYPFAKSQH